MRGLSIPLLCILLGGLFQAAAAEPDATVDHLLKTVRASGATFVRNGDKHSAADAADHMQKKYDHYLKKGKIKTAEDFILLAATRSLVSGKAYTLELPDGSTQETADWMREQLKQYRNAKTKPAS